MTLMSCNKRHLRMLVIVHYMGDWFIYYVILKSGQIFCQITLIVVLALPAQHCTQALALTRRSSRGGTEKAGPFV